MFYSGFSDKHVIVKYNKLIINISQYYLYPSSAIKCICLVLKENLQSLFLKMFIASFGTGVNNLA